jgi:hypothetical protein
MFNDPHGVSGDNASTIDVSLHTAVVIVNGPMPAYGDEGGMDTVIRTLSRCVDTSGITMRASPSGPVLTVAPIGAFTPVNFNHSTVAGVIGCCVDECTSNVSVRDVVMFVGCVAFWHDARTSVHIRSAERTLVFMFTIPNAA